LSLPVAVGDSLDRTTDPIAGQEAEHRLGLMSQLRAWRRAAGPPAPPSPKPKPPGEPRRPAEKVRVRLLRSYGRHWPGDFITVRRGLADTLLKIGAAEPAAG
jgi:hypothetical protein